MVYYEALPFAQHFYLTEVDSIAPDADSFFPVFNLDEYTREIIRKGKEDDLAYSFVKYSKK